MSRNSKRVKFNALQSGRFALTKRSAHTSPANIVPNPNANSLSLPGTPPGVSIAPSNLNSTCFSIILSTS
jgi:hypothetical protein